eukprot:gene30937-42975_t
MEVACPERRKRERGEHVMALPHSHTPAPAGEGGLSALALACGRGKGAGRDSKSSTPSDDADNSQMLAPAQGAASPQTPVKPHPPTAAGPIELDFSGDAFAPTRP